MKNPFLLMALSIAFLASGMHNFFHGKGFEKQTSKFYAPTQSNNFRVNRIKKKRQMKGWK
jgi:hypothetical protein